MPSDLTFSQALKAREATLSSFCLAVYPIHAQYNRCQINLSLDVPISYLEIVAPRKDYITSISTLLRMHASVLMVIGKANQKLSIHDD